MCSWQSRLHIPRTLSNILESLTGNLGALLTKLNEAYGETRDMKRTTGLDVPSKLARKKPTFVWFKEPDILPWKVPLWPVIINQLTNWTLNSVFLQNVRSSLSGRALLSTICCSAAMWWQPVMPVGTGYLRIVDGRALKRGNIQVFNLHQAFIHYLFSIISLCWAEDEFGKACVL